MDLRNNVAVVTGASAGIGAATVKALLKLGMKVVGFARRKEKIEELQVDHKENLFPLKVDLTKSHEIIEAFDWVTKNVGPVCVLINNAGVVSNASVLEGDLEKWQQLFDTNFMSIAVCCKEAVKIMKEHDIDGYIVNINSVVGYYDLCHPKAVMYSSLKKALIVMTENLRVELARKNSKIRISTLAPGAVKTEIQAGRGWSQEEIDSFYNKVPYLKPDDVADTIIYLLSTPKHVHITEMLVRCVGEDLFGTYSTLSQKPPTAGH